MRFPGNVVTAEDTRANGSGTPEKCFYCSGKTGGPHDDECVCIERPVKVRVTLDLVIAQPRSWDKDSIEFHMNDSSWCFNNIRKDIERQAKAGCLCSVARAEYIGEATLDEAIEAGLTPDQEHD